MGEAGVAIVIDSKTFDNGKVFCGRPGCSYQLGRRDRMVEAGQTVRRLFLSGHWEWDGDTEPARWRHGKHRKRGFPRTDPPGAKSMIFGNRREYAIIDPTIIECARCGTVQTA
jgi:hypothetical protein